MSGYCYYGGAVRMNPEIEESERNPMFGGGYPHKMPQVYLEGEGEMHDHEYGFNRDDDSVVVVRDKRVMKYTLSTFIELLAKNEEGETVWMDGRCAPYSNCWEGEYLNEYREGQEYTVEEYNLETNKKTKYKVILNEESELDIWDYHSLSKYVDADKLGSHFKIEDGVLKQYVGNDTDLIIPEGVTEVGYNPFMCEKEFETIVFPSTLVKISDSIFKNCKVKEIIVAEENPRLYSKDGCLFDKETSTLIWGYAATDIPDNPEIFKVGDCAFFGRNDLKHLVIPDNITEVGWSAFSSCINLKSVKFSNSNCIIKGRCFDDCYLLSEVALPNMLEEIDDYTFAACDSLKTLEIPTSVQEIGVFAFGSCENLKKINIPDVLIKSLLEEFNAELGLVRRGDKWAIEKTFKPRSFAGFSF